MRRYVICCKLTDPSSVEGVGFELAVNDVVESDLLPRHPGARVIRRHQEHGEHHHHDHEPDHCRAPLTWSVSVAFGWSNISYWKCKVCAWQCDQMRRVPRTEMMLARQFLGSGLEATSSWKGITFIDCIERYLPRTTHYCSALSLPGMIVPAGPT